MLSFVTVSTLGCCAYIAFLTDVYPPVGIEKGGRPGSSCPRRPPAGTDAPRARR